MSWPWTVVYLVISVLCLYPGSFIIASGQGQIMGFKVLKSGDNGQCPSMEERERARNELHQIIESAIASTTITPTPTETTTPAISTLIPTTTSTMSITYTCNGTPGWRRVAFIDMTDTSYNCPTGLNLTSYSKRTCGQSHTFPDVLQPHSVLEVYHTAVCVGG